MARAGMRDVEPGGAGQAAARRPEMDAGVLVKGLPWALLAWGVSGGVVWGLWVVWTAALR